MFADYNNNEQTGFESLFYHFVSLLACTSGLVTVDLELRNCSVFTAKQVKRFKAPRKKLSM
jgi:hypothetical protein